jgi:hypothetical protein
VAERAASGRLLDNNFPIAVGELDGLCQFRGVIEQAEVFAAVKRP